MSGRGLVCHWVVAASEPLCERREPDGAPLELSEIERINLFISNPQIAHVIDLYCKLL